MGRTAYRTRDYLNQGAAQVRERQPTLAGAPAAAEAVKQAKSGLAWFGRWSEHLARLRALMVR